MRRKQQQSLDKGVCGFDLSISALTALFPELKGALESLIFNLKSAAAMKVRGAAC